MKDDRAREYIPVERVVTVFGDSLVSGLDTLVGRIGPQSSLGTKSGAFIRSDRKNKGGILVDFGREMYGGIRLTTGNHSPAEPVRVRIRFGESVAEAIQGGVNEHGIDDAELALPWLASVDFGNTGFRFVRLDLLDECTSLELQGLCAVSIYRDLPRMGSFESNDERLNRIFKTAVDTVHLNMQEYIWDGIKRDRLVWAGDMHPEICVIAAVFGDTPVVRKTLDLMRDEWPLPRWMNDYSSYTLWWIITHRDWYRLSGDGDYLGEQREYFIGLVDLLERSVDESGKENLPPARFLDWPTRDDEEAIHAGLQSLMIMAAGALAEMLERLDERAAKERCEKLVTLLGRWTPAMPKSKQAAALMSLSGQSDPKEVNSRILSVDPFRGISTFYGYYVLEARALAGDIAGGMELIRKYWGAMLDFGATSFWEGFDLSWTKDSGPIDALPQPDRKDIHADFGEYCYVGLRHSLCHGWAGGPAAWLINHVLGLRITEPGGTRVEARPCLGDLSWAAGSIATPFGPVHISCLHQDDGGIRSQVKAPEEVEVTVIDGRNSR
jgi:hypothetical protein